MNAMTRFSFLMVLTVALPGCGSLITSNSGGSNGANSYTDVTVNFTGILPTAVATQIGSGSFSSATLSSSSLSLQIPNGTTNFAVAFVCPPETYNTGGSGGGDGSGTFDGDGSTTIIVEPSQVRKASKLSNDRGAGLQFAKTQDTSGSNLWTTQQLIAASTLDGTSFTTGCSNQAAASPTYGSLTGTIDVSALSYPWLFSVGAENESSGAWLYAGSVSSFQNFTISAPTGSDRVLLSVSNDNPLESDLIAAKSLDNQTVPGALNNGNPVVFNAADAVTNQPIVYENVPAGFPSPTTSIAYVLSGMIVPPGIQDGVWLSSFAGNRYPALPTSVSQSGDYYSFWATTGNSATSMGVFTTTASGGPMTMSFPAAWNYPGPVAAAWPTFANLGYMGFTGSGTEAVVLNIGWLSASGNYGTYIVSASSNTMNGVSSQTFPDLSTIPGFLPSPSSGETVYWTATLSQSTYGFLQPISANGTVASVDSTGSYVVP